MNKVGSARDKRTLFLLAELSQQSQKRLPRVPTGPRTQDLTIHKSVEPSLSKNLANGRRESDHESPVSEALGGTPEEEIKNLLLFRLSTWLRPGKILARRLGEHALEVAHRVGELGLADLFAVSLLAQRDHSLRQQLGGGR